MEMNEGICLHPLQTAAETGTFHTYFSRACLSQVGEAEWDVLLSLALKGLSINSICALPALV